MASDPSSDAPSGAASDRWRGVPAGPEILAIGRHPGPPGLIFR